MRVFLYELKKLWNWRILLIIAVTGILTWLFHAKYDVPEVILCCAVMLTGITTAFIVAARERRLDV